MAPIYVKGGIWTNVEDEILKLSISKYGLNQWSRVSSLLAKKTAKQCKARWHEWLDPNIRKIEWSKEEDAKLLRTIKLIPNQWRTIAPIVGRTLAQCIDRYQQLLDEANDEINGDNEFGLQGPGIESVAAVGSKVQIGDLHLNPESKPARPDAEEMDEEEKEMLSEARARLANTQGKKAKRKARERMLDETRRVALLQKRRELKNAGININLQKKKKGDDKHIDYSAEIPVYERPAVGFYDTSEETERNLKEQRDFELNVRKHGTKNVEFEKQEKREKRNRDKQITVGQDEILKQEDFKRRKLVIPEPVNILVEEDQHLSDVDEDAIYLARGLLEGKEETGKLDEAKRKSELPSSSLLNTSLAEQHNEDDFENYVDEFETEQQQPTLIDIKSRLASLPAPKNKDYDIDTTVPVDPFDDIEEDDVVVIASPKPQVVDQGELQRQAKLEQERELAKSLLRRSQVLQRGLPIPNLDSTYEIKLGPDDQSSVHRLRDRELVLLIRSDYQKKHGSGDLDNGANSIIPDPDADTLDTVQKMINEELSSNSTLSLQDFQKLVDPIPPSGLPGLDRSITPPSQNQIESLVNELKTTAAKSAKLEKKFLVLNGGYAKRYEALITKTRDLERQLLHADLQLKTYVEIEALERVAIEKRQLSLQESVELLVDAENVGQKRYDDLIRRV